LTIASLHKLERRLARWCDRGLGRTWVVAVSGGSDSVGLLRILHELSGRLDLTLSVAHLDHGARGEASRADAAFVSELVGALGLPFDLGEWRPARTGHFEADARRARYAWLTEIAQTRRAAVIAVGHTHDDQAETILHRILRGTGPRGLAGIAATRRLASGPELTLVRPLLKTTRSEIREYLAAVGQPYREDASNADRSHTRARIRHDLLPELAAEYNPDVTGALVRLGSLARALERSLQGDLRALVRQAVLSRAPDCIVLKHGVLRSLPSFLRAEVLRRVWRRAGWPEASMSAERWRRLAALARRPEVPRVEVGGRVEVSTDRFFLVLRRVVDPERSSRRAVAVESIPLLVPGRTPLSWMKGEIEISSDPGAGTQCDETIDLEQVALPLLVRGPVVGDRFTPLGLPGASQALADFFRGRRVPREQRASIPLVCDQIGIIWVVGHRISERVKLTAQTRRTLGLNWTGFTRHPERAAPQSER
jgi:tRNA(Ile)-lysidine synthase